MNIFDIYSEKIKTLVKNLNKQNLIEIPDSLNGINVDKEFQQIYQIIEKRKKIKKTWEFNN